MTYSILALGEFGNHGEFFVAAETSERDSSRLIPIEQRIDIDDTGSVAGPLDRTSMGEERGHELFRSGNLNDGFAVADLQWSASISGETHHGSRGLQSISGGR
jgi:hypothetical protein